jgi:hypothetical protein
LNIAQGGGGATAGKKSGRKIRNPKAEIRRKSEIPSWRSQSQSAREGTAEYAEYAEKAPDCLGFPRISAYSAVRKSPPFCVRFRRDEANAEIAELSGIGSAFNTETTGASVSRSNRTG